MRATVIAVAKYEREVKRLLAESERSAMKEAIAADPEAHPAIPGTGGVRKARWGRRGKGESGGVRAIYYYMVSGGTVYMLSIYSKGDQEDMTPDGRKAARKFVEDLKNARKESRE